jgi:hypothetical protein
MIVRAEGDRLVLFRQGDHAHLSGRLAAAWGLTPWAVPAPYPATILGARLHDDAWQPFDEDPTVEGGRPLSFFEVDRVTSTALYSAGAAAVSELDPYAGLMVSLHYSGFFESHWGWAPFSTPERFPAREAEALRRFLEVEAGRQRDLRAALALDDSSLRQLEVNYKWLQVWDRVSLDICRQPTVEPWAVEYPAVPVSYAGDDALPLKFAMVAPGSYTLNPYPLLIEPFNVVMPAVTLDAGFPSPEAFRAAWRTASPGTVRATITST